jgi:hypothetical protein
MKEAGAFFASAQQLMKAMRATAFRFLKEKKEHARR